MRSTSATRSGSGWSRRRPQRAQLVAQRRSRRWPSRASSARGRAGGRPARRPATDARRLVDAEHAGLDGVVGAARAAGRGTSARARRPERHQVARADPPAGAGEQAQQRGAGGRVGQHPQRATTSRPRAWPADRRGRPPRPAGRARRSAASSARDLRALAAPAPPRRAQWRLVGCGRQSPAARRRRPGRRPTRASSSTSVQQRAAHDSPVVLPARCRGAAAATAARPRSRSGVGDAVGHARRICRPLRQLVRERAARAGGRRRRRSRAGSGRACRRSPRASRRSTGTGRRPRSPGGRRRTAPRAARAWACAVSWYSSSSTTRNRSALDLAHLGVVAGELGGQRDDLVAEVHQLRLALARGVRSHQRQQRKRAALELEHLLRRRRSTLRRLPRRALGAARSAAPASARRRVDAGARPARRRGPARRRSTVGSAQVDRVHRRRRSARPRASASCQQAASVSRRAPARSRAAGRARATTGRRTSGRSRPSARRATARRRRRRGRAAAAAARAGRSARRRRSPARRPPCG